MQDFGHQRVDADAVVGAFRQGMPGQTDGALLDILARGLRCERDFLGLVEQHGEEVLLAIIRAESAQYQAIRDQVQRQGMIFQFRGQPKNVPGRTLQHT